MDNKYLNQIQELLKNNNSNDPSNQVQSNEENTENKENLDEIPQKKISNNIDDITIKDGNFNELLEKEMSKEQNEGYAYNDMNTNVEPRFKYVPKKRTDIISAPTNTKKYKYYSDNFKSKKSKKEKNEEKTDDNINNNFNIKNIKNQKKDSNYNYGYNNKRKEKVEKFDKYEKENFVKEPPLSSNQNKKEGKIVDRKFDFAEFKQKQNTANTKKNNFPQITNNKYNKTNKIKENPKPKYNNFNNNNNNKKTKGINENVMDFESFKKKKNLGNNNKNKINLNTR